MPKGRFYLTCIQAEDDGAGLDIRSISSQACDERPIALTEGTPMSELF